MQSRRKTAAIVTAVTLAVAILLTGTFAWRSISQQAKNEIIRAVNPGGRLHDDFNGENKDVYVENFFTTNEGGQPIFARVRLDEYMETGPDAGLDKPGRDVRPLVSGTDFNDVNTWKPYILGDTTSAFREYWELTMGAGEQTVFLPTFNKNKDSLKAEINGTYAGKDGDMENGTPYDDYETYTVGQKVVGDEILDADPEDDDEGDAAILGDDYTIRKDTEHVAKLTGITKKVLTMTEWESMGSPVGPYWVFDNSDSNGWFYWAQPILPGQSTGLLLDKMEWIGEDVEGSDPTYYAINVKGQFATAGQWGSATGGAGGAGDGFYEPSAGNTAPSAKALALLEHVSGIAKTVTIKEKHGETTVAPGESLEFSATVKQKDATPDQTVTWSLVEAGTSTDTKVDETTGALTVGAGETAKTLTIRATTTADPKVRADYLVTVKAAPATTP